MGEAWSMHERDQKYIKENLYGGDHLVDSDVRVDVRITLKSVLKEYVKICTGLN
jgi:hypothetical protein